MRVASRGVVQMISDAREGLKAAVAKVLTASLRRGPVHFPCSALANASFPDNFPDEAAIRRSVGALQMQQSEECAMLNDRMSLESLATMSDNPPNRLPAAPALAQLQEATRAEEPGSNSNASYTTSRHANRP